MMPDRVIAAYVIIAVMAAAGIVLFLYLSRGWRADRRASIRHERSRRAKAQERRFADQDGLNARS